MMGNDGIRVSAHSGIVIALAALSSFFPTLLGNIVQMRAGVTTRMPTIIMYASAMAGVNVMRRPDARQIQHSARVWK
jgi:hypothetical protein